MIKTSYSEFSSQLNDKNIVVIEFGRRFTRCGFAGESSPRAIIRTAVHGKDNEVVYLSNITDLNHLQVSVTEFIEKIYFNYLAVSPREKKVVIVESIFCQSTFRNIITRIFFEHFDVPSILFVPDHLMALATLGSATGLVVDIGAEEASTIAVVEGVTLLDGSQFASLGGQSLDSLIAQEVKKANPEFKELRSELVEDIRIKTCFVAPYRRGIKMTIDKYEKTKRVRPEIPFGTKHCLADPDDESPATVNYPVRGDSSLTIAGNLREGACEIFFEIYGNEQCLTTMVLETIMMAPIDCRRILAENILVIGGLANLPGLEHRLLEELKNTDGYERYKCKMPSAFKFHKAICPKNYVSWLGASMFCTSSATELRSTTREQWMKDGKKNLIEWSDLVR